MLKLSIKYHQNHIAMSYLKPSSFKTDFDFLFNNNNIQFFQKIYNNEASDVLSNDSFQTIIFNSILENDKELYDDICTIFSDQIIQLVNDSHFFQISKYEDFYKYHPDTINAINLENVSINFDLSFFKNLSLLTLNNCNIKNLKDLQSLAYVNLAHNMIETIHNCNFSNTVYLDLSSNILTDLNFIQCATNICYLDLSFNNLTISMKNLSHMTNIKVLNLSHTKLIWTEAQKFESLEELYVSNCCLTCFPDITLFQNPKKLDVSQNMIKEFPINFTDLSNLIELNVNSNQISNFLILKEMNNLNRISFKSNLICENQIYIQLDRKFSSSQYNNSDHDRFDKFNYFEKEVFLLISRCDINQLIREFCTNYEILDLLSSIFVSYTFRKPKYFLNIIKCYSKMQNVVNLYPQRDLDKRSKSLFKSCMYNCNGELTTEKVKLHFREIISWIFDGAMKLTFNELQIMKAIFSMMKLNSALFQKIKS